MNFFFFLSMFQAQRVARTYDPETKSLLLSWLNQAGTLDRRFLKLSCSKTEEEKVFLFQFVRVGRLSWGRL